LPTHHHPSLLSHWRLLFIHYRPIVHPSIHPSFPSVSLIADPGGRGERRESTSRRLAGTYNTRNPKGKAPPLTSNLLSLPPPLPPRLPAKPGAVSDGAHLPPIHPSILPTHQRREDDIHPSSNIRTNPLGRACNNRPTCGKESRSGSLSSGERQGLLQHFRRIFSRSRPRVFPQ
jgi:hypothetical protein